MTANEIAAQFARQFPNGGWISPKQAAWLVGVWQQEARQGLRQLNRETGHTCAGPKSYEAYGNVYEGETLVATWSVSISPRNGCGNFRVTPVVTVADPRIQQLADLKAGVARLQELGVSEDIWGFTVTMIENLERQLGIAA